MVDKLYLSDHTPQSDQTQSLAQSAQTTFIPQAIIHPPLHPHTFPKHPTMAPQAIPQPHPIPQAIHTLLALERIMKSPQPREYMFIFTLSSHLMLLYLLELTLA